MISLRFLGTGALGSVRVKNKFSKEYRRFPTLLIDEKILIDPSEDIFEFMESFMLGSMLDNVSDIFVTHSHLDHFSVSTLEKLAKTKKIRVFASSAMKDELIALKNVDYIEIAPFTIQRLDKYTVIPLPAIHKTDIPFEASLNFLIEVDGKNILYALDGAMIHPAAMEILKEIKLEAVILDCALGLDDYSDKSTNHNNLDMARIIRKILISCEAATDNTKFILSHIPSVKRRFIHDELCEAIGDSQFRVAYDGYFLGL